MGARALPTSRSLMCPGIIMTPAHGPAVGPAGLAACGGGRAAAPAPAGATVTVLGGGTRTVKLTRNLRQS